MYITNNVHQIKCESFILKKKRKQRAIERIEGFRENRGP
jgi:hypothetical protein